LDEPKASKVLSELFGNEYALRNRCCLGWRLKQKAATGIPTSIFTISPPFPPPLFGQLCTTIETAKQDRKAAEFSIMLEH